MPAPYFTPSMFSTSRYRDQHEKFCKWSATLGYSQASQEHHSRSVLEFFYWLEQRGVRDERAVNGQEIKSWQAYLQYRPNLNRPGGLSATTINNKVSNIALYYSYLQQKGEVQAHPLSEKVLLPRSSKLTRSHLLTLEDIKKLHGACKDSRERALLALLYGCGLRRQEAVKLDIADINFKSALLLVREGKGRKSRQVPLGGQVLEDLKTYYYHGRHRWLKDLPTHAFLVNNYGARMQGHSYCRMIRSLLCRVKLTVAVTPHHFRHAIATHLLEAGVSVEQVKDFLGHKTLEATQVYTHISAGYLKKEIRYEL